MARADCEALPYDMGNAGDLLKHGVLAEFVRWQCEQGKSFRFFDLFGGEPYGKPVAEVAKRVHALPECTLRAAQTGINDDRYYGSGLLVRKVAEQTGNGSVLVFTDDSCPARRKRLRDSGLLILHEEFPDYGVGPDGEYDGYTAFRKIIEEAKDDDLVLIDPFAEFLKGKAKTVIPQMEETAKRAAVLLFALNLKPHNSVGRKFDDLLKRHLRGAWRMTCSRLPKRGIRGESKYDAEIVLATQSFLEHRESPDIVELRTRIEDFTKNLADVLNLPAQQLMPRVIGGAVP